MSPTMISPLHLYELCVQRPDVLAPWLERLHGNAPRTLHEDMCGSGSLSRAWAARSPHHLAIGIDLDAPTVEFAASAAGACHLSARARFHVGDAIDAPTLLAHEPPADVIFVGNFSIGELHTRPRLLAYLKNARARLNPRGIFVCDTYAGAPAWRA